MKEILSNLRKDYIQKELTEMNVDSDPIIQFEHWFNAAIENQVNEPNAMVLSTVNENNTPSSRIVLLKNASKSGFTFFTNYNSDKGKQMEYNSNVSLLIFWAELEQQIRIEGKVEKVSKAESESYFHSRPRESQISAWASPQSHVVKNREELDRLRLEQEAKWKDKSTIDLPDFWGGYIVIPSRIEFWQGRASRYHDRIVYTKINEGWKIERLAP